MVINIVHALEQRMGRPIGIRLLEWQEAPALVVQGKADGTLARIIATWQPKEIVFQTREQALRHTVVNILFGGSGCGGGR